MRETPVAAPKIAVDRIRCLRCELPPSPPCDPPRDARDVTAVGSPRKSIGGGPVCYDRLCPCRWRALSMPNIRQQKKRVRSAGRQRLENLRYRSTVKTLTRRLREAVDEG